MFILPNAMKNIRRNIRKSVLYFLICVIAVMTLQVYMAGIDRTEAQLLQLPDAIPVLARIASLDASRFAGLQIQEKTVNGLLNSSYVRQLLLTVLLRGGIGHFAAEESRGQLTLNVVGVNSIAALEGLESEAITWLPGYSQDVLAGDETVCLIESNLMKTYKVELGDSIPLNLYYYRYTRYGEVTYEPLELAETRIIAVADLSAVVTDMTSPQIVVPIKSCMASFHRQDVVFNASSASFFVDNSLELNAFKAEMKTLDLEQFDPAKNSSLTASKVLANQGTTLLVNDATFISAATRLQDSLSLLKGFLPMLAVVLAVIGYLVAYLMIQNRREEYAVFRLIGMSKSKSMGLYSIEIAALTLAGSLSGTVLSAATGIAGFNSGIKILFMFMLCFTLGGISAVFRLGNVNLMLAFARAD